MWTTSEIARAYWIANTAGESIPCDKWDDYFADTESAYYGELAALGYEIPDEV